MNYKEKIEKTRKELTLSAEVLREKLQGYFNTDQDVNLGDNNHVINLDKDDVDSIISLHNEVKTKIETLEYIIKYLPDKSETVVINAIHTIGRVKYFLNVLDLENNIGLGHIDKEGLGSLE